MKKQLLTVLALAFLLISNAYAASVKVTMNTVSTTMKLANMSTGETIDVGEPANRVYTFDAPVGKYVLTGYATNGTTENGTFVINITEDGDNDFTIITCTAYATNSGWVADQDYTVEVEVNSKEGERQEITIGNSITAGRKTFLALEGNSYNATLKPSESHQAEGYLDLFRQGTLNFNVNISGVIPMGADFTITIPSDAELYLGTKTAHFISFREVEPKSVETTGSSKNITYFLGNNTVYNYRTWKKDGLTQAGYFTMNTDESKRPELSFTDKDYTAFGPNTIKHDVQWNSGYETGDIFVNINERGHLRMNVGDTFDAHAMRTWELTDNSTNNYFIEPDFHYTVIDVNGKASKGVIEIENPDGGPDPWTTIKAVGNGTAIVLVTYDAIGLNYYNNQNTKTPYMGGEYWSAIWPENTAAYVVTVGEGTTSMDPNMVINEAYNLDTKKLAQKYVDAEHDVFYYLDTEEGFTYTFTPSGVANVEIAYPTIGKRSATYKGFATTGVTKNEDGSYSLLLKEGRQIVRLTDASGNAIYQVLTAKKCHRDITNITRKGSSTFIPGDEVKIQYSGLFHPANKLAGIYNMSAYVTYNGVPNGTSLILGAGQYTFGSVASAQAVTITIPKDHDVNTTPEIVMNDGVIQVNGFGDPIGNHRNTSRVTGRYPNFTAVAHKTYFGAIPEVRIPLMAATPFVIHIEANADDVEYTLTRNGVSVTVNEDGTYTGTYGDYELTASKAGYRCFRNTYTINDGAEGDQTFYVELEKVDENAWDGKSKNEPTEENGIYQISNGAELAWFADQVNSGQVSKSAVLVADIDLADYTWTPIGGGTTAKAFHGTFDGNNHSIEGLYINNTATYQGLFGYIYTGTVKKVTVSGEVSAKQYVGGISGSATAAVIDSCVNNVILQSTSTYIGGITSQIANNTNVTNCVNNAEVTGSANYVGGITANIAANSTVDRCANNGKVKGAGNYVGGIAGYVAQATSTLSNSYNIGDVESTAGCAGIAGSNQMNAVITNVYNLGKITGKNVASCVGGTTEKNNVTKSYSVDSYDITTNQTNVTRDQVRNGNLAHMLGEPFGQEIESDKYPVINGPKVYQVTYTTNLDSYVVTIYINSTLPTSGWVDDRSSTWYTERGGEVITEIDSDCTLYVELLLSGIKDTVARQGIENGIRYNLAGQRVDENYKGVVIMNGKKFVVK